MKVNIPKVNMPRIVIVGGGFGGLAIAKALKNKRVQVVLIDKNNYHTFQPLLYQVATAGLEADSIAFPLRKILNRYNHFYFRMAKVLSVDADKKQLQTTIGPLNYDYLAIATGSETNYFGMQDMMNESVPMKSIPEALNLRSLILQNFEKALSAILPEERDSLMNFVVIGGGPTGVELSGALAELKKDVLPKDYPDLNLNQMQIHLIETAPRLLASMDKRSSAKALSFLHEMGVNVLLETSVTGIKDNHVTTNTGKTFNSQSVIWTAGVKGSFFDGFDKDKIVKGNRLKVDQFNKVEGYEDIYAIGDAAAMIIDKLPKGHPMLAPVAIQQGKLLARNLVNKITGKPMKPFIYRDLGTMATVGRHKAVVELGRLKIQGWLAWYIWMFVHLMSLVGFRNRVIVFINWLWNYINYDKGERLIIRPFQKKARAEGKESPIG